jgi:hypothetical protein
MKSEVKKITGSIFLGGDGGGLSKSRHRDISRLEKVRSELYKSLPTPRQKIAESAFCAEHLSHPIPGHTKGEISRPYGL